MEEWLNTLSDFAAQTGGITSDVQQLSLSLTELAASVDAVHESFEKTWKTIDTGARLQGLSSVTGEPVARLYEFERGLDAVGRKARYLPAIFADMQRALSHTGGTSRAEEAFAELHLDPDELRKKDTADAVIQFATALGKLDPNEATRVGNQVFGRFRTESVLAMARNMDLFEQTMRQSSHTGALLEQYSKTFEEVKAGRMGINDDILGMQAALAGKIAPGILDIYAGAFDDAKNMGLSWPLTHSGNPDYSLGQNHYRPEFTSLEKMGFIMSGAKVHNPYDQRKIDLLRQIVHNTSLLEHHGFGPAQPALRYDPIAPPIAISHMV
jgi:hypothetical protein